MNHLLLCAKVNIVGKPDVVGYLKWETKFWSDLLSMRLSNQLFFSAQLVIDGSSVD